MALTLQEKNIFNSASLSMVLRKCFFTIFLFNIPMYTLSAENEVKDIEYIFDPALFKGGHFDQASLEMLTRPGAISPGLYKLELYVNQKFIGHYEISYLANEGSVIPCFSSDIIEDIGFKDNNNLIKNTAQKCFFLHDISDKATSKTELSQLRLNLFIPQALLNIQPRGYVSPNNYEVGSNIGFINYLANYYHVSYANNYTTNTDSAWLSLNGGINLGSLQYRQISTATWNKTTGYTWTNIRSYIQKPLTTFTSQFMAGQLITSGLFFSGMSYNGINLSTADAMLPDSMRGYAPVIRGIASSNAKVTVSQNGQEIYQTTVPPGDFEINDLYPTSYSGDLQVKITEADGNIKTFIVPFSAVPDSMRPGMSRYNISFGRTRNTEKSSFFGDIVYQRGLTNSITANGGIRFAENYFAAVVGGVYTNSLGAFGLDTTISRAELPGNEINQGQMTRISWSKTFQSAGTTISLASYQYSTEGYRDLIEILNTQYNELHSNNLMYQSSNQRSRFDITLSQVLGAYGNVFISGSTQNYRNRKPRDTQIQLGYSKAFEQGVSMNISLARQHIGNYDHSGNTETATAISFSIPLSDNRFRGTNLSASYNHSQSSGDQYQTTLSGVFDDEQTLNYNINVMQDQKYNQTTFSGSLQKRLPKANLGINMSTNKEYWQMSGNAQGAFAIHSGGVTFGPYLGDTFALVEAKGAEGAKLFTSSQTRIDNNGYALVPAVTPYKYNSISIDPQGMKGNAEVLDSQKRIVPIAGAGVKVKFRTRIGNAVLIKTITETDNMIPMGSQVFNEKNESVGISGQNGQIYARVEQDKGQLIVRWGENNNYCFLPYDLEKIDKEQSLITITARCHSPLKGSQ